MKRTVVFSVLALIVILLAALAWLNLHRDAERAKPPVANTILEKRRRFLPNDGNERKAPVAEAAAPEVEGK